jgi:hypothetical protein
MSQKLKGGTGASSNDDGDDDAFGTSDNEKEDCDESNVADTEMPEDYSFTGMIAFFLGGSSLSLQSRRCIVLSNFK